LGVALVNGGNARENRELMDLLARIGLHPQGVVLPDVSFHAFESVRRASLFVWASQSALRDVAELVFADLPVSLLTPPAPAGVSATLDWLRRVVHRLEPESEPARALAALAAEAPWLGRLGALRRQAAEHALAFAVDAPELELVWDTTPLYAYSLLDLVLEMGFSVRLLAYGDPSGFEPARARVAARGLAERVTFAPFASRAELLDGLRAPRVGAVFSNFQADPRAVAAGRATFSEADVELGIEGFFRTAERLLRRCRTRPLAGFEAWSGEVA